MRTCIWRTGIVSVAIAATAIGMLAPSASPAAAATYTDGACVGTSGVTVVVDATRAGGTVTVRCALGPQASGWEALGHAGHDVVSVPEFPGGAVCTIDGRPVEGYPTCWESAYWSYWRAPNTGAGSTWTYSLVGAAIQRPPLGSVEGWAYGSLTTAIEEPGAGPAFAAGGYWMVEADGSVSAFGGAADLGDAGPNAADIESTPSGAGYWVVDARGSVFAFGNAPYLGGAGPLLPGEVATSISRTDTGAGYWIFTSRGRALPFGDAHALGDLAAFTLNGPVLDSVSTPSGNGYFMVASDGGVFAFGDAQFAGSTGGLRLNAPVQSLVPDGDGSGYWLVASDGGVFAFDAPFRGSTGGITLNRPVSGMVRYGNGYVMVAEDGGAFSFSDLPFHGSLGATPPDSPVVSIAGTS
jgi:hypothetical protein